MHISLTSKILRVLGALFAVIIGLYPVLYFLNGSHFRLRATKSEALLGNALWNTGFYAHITCAGIALLIGWLQFNNKLRIRKPAVHRTMGKIYLALAITGAFAGTCISLKATGGLVPALGFFLLGIVWISVTWLAYKAIRSGNVPRHRTLMIYSYACCFAAVTLRLWLTGLQVWLPFGVAYSIVAWLSWLPNLIVAWLITHRPAPRIAATT